MDEVLKDERFSHILTDPRFRKIPKNVRKIKVDNRFKNLFKSKNFKEKCRVDERGRSLNLDPSENLQKLYNLDEEVDECNVSPEKDEHSVSARKKEKKASKKLKGKTNNVETSFNKTDKKEFSLTDSKNQNNTVKCKKSNKKNFDKSDQNDICNVSPKKESVEIDVKKNLFKVDNLNRISKRIKSLKKTFSKKEQDPRFIMKEESEEENESSSSEEDTLKDDRFTLKNMKSDKKAEPEESDEEESDKSEEENESEKSGEEESELSSSEEESEESDSEDSISDKSESFDHQWEEQHERAPDADEITRRLAVCNMDWDRIRAQDLYVVFNSFKPADTSVLSVKIYPSEFGLKRMEEEKLKGPPELVEKTLDPDEEEADDMEDIKGGRYNREKLRQYQMNRLKYYYAVVECDTPETANSLYEHLNGMEYESSSVRFDLRFIPDDMTFDQEPTSTADNVPDLTEYKPRLFVTTALQQVNVGLTWDETDPHRRETLQKAFTEPESIENDIKNYLASSSGDSEDEISDEENTGDKLSSKDRIQKFRDLLKSIDEQENEKDKDKYEMEITWEPGVKEKTETLVKEKLEEKTYTPFEESLKKKKEKQKLKRKEKKTKTNEEEELKDSHSDESDSDVSQETSSKGEKLVSKKSDELYLISDAKKLDEDSQKSKKKKKKKVKENKEDVQVDINDPRFSAIYTSPLFNIDPSDPHFKDTPGNLAIIAEKQRRLKNKATSQGGSSKKFKYN